MYKRTKRFFSIPTFDVAVHSVLPAMEVNEHFIVSSAVITPFEVAVLSVLLAMEVNEHFIVSSVVIAPKHHCFHQLTEDNSVNAYLSSVMPQTSLILFAICILT